MIKPKTITLTTGIVAAGISLGAGISAYRDYFDDPDLIPKIVFDISGKVEEEKLVLTKVHPNKLYEYVQRNDDSFKKELEKESRFFSQAYHVGKQNELDPLSRQIPYFADREHFLAYLLGNRVFLKKSLERGHFLDAAIAAYQLGIEKSRVEMLLEKADIQMYKTGSALQFLNVSKMEKPKLEELAMKEQLIFMSNEIREIQQRSSARVLNQFGETKKRVIDLAEKRYREFVEKYSDGLTQREREEYKQLFMPRAH